MFGKHKMSLWCADAMLLNSQQIFTSTKPHRWQGGDDAEPSNLLDYSWFIPWQPLQRCSFLHHIVWVKTAVRTVLYLKLDRLWSEVLQRSPCAGSITAPCLPGDSCRQLFVTTVWLRVSQWLLLIRVGFLNTILLASLNLKMRSFSKGDRIVTLIQVWSHFPAPPYNRSRNITHSLCLFVCLCGHRVARALAWLHFAALKAELVCCRLSWPNKVTDVLYFYLYLFLFFYLNKCSQPFRPDSVQLPPVL